MFDINRLNPKRIYPGIKRRLKELPHLYVWNYTKAGREKEKHFIYLQMVHLSIKRISVF
jgi:hypothetical protein